MIERTDSMTAAEIKDARLDYFEGASVSPPRGHAAGNLTLLQFLELVYNILQVEQPDLLFAPAYPNYLIPETDAHTRTMDNPTESFKDTITFQVTREEPGSIGGDKQPFGDTREVVPRLREQVPDSNDELVNIYGQWFDTLVQFDVWSLTNYEVDQMALWFKRFMTIHRNFFKEMGLSEILFWWRGVDDVSSKLRNSLHVRTLVYYIRTEEIMSDKDFILKELRYQLTLRSEEN